jgi:predicted dehydrogenase
VESRIRIGTLGAAKITPLALLQPAAVIPATAVVAVGASTRVKAETFAATHGIPGIYDSYEALVDAPDIDLVYNALPINRHADLSIRALEAGKDVLCEKPFAMNAAEAEAVGAAAERTGRRVIEAFHYRYHPAFIACLTAVREGHIGTIKSIDARFAIGIPFDPAEIRHRPDTGGGAMMDLGCYPLHWTLTLLDAAPTDVQAVGTLTAGGVDESMDAELAFADGATARLHCSMAGGLPFSATLEVQGSRGSILFENPLHPHSGGSLVIVNEDRQETIAINPITTYTWQLATLVDALRSGETLPTEGAATLRQQRALDAVYAAAGLENLRFNP